MINESSARKVISIVSGKGGTGKSLLTAVLGRALAREHVRVLIVDCDVFVRGLTILFTESGKKPIRASDELTFSDILKPLDADDAEFNEHHLLIERFFECDLLPAVSRVADIFNIPELQLTSDLSRAAIKKLLDKIPNDYDLILLDNRAGIDNLVLASCKESDIVLTVGEDDPVALQTNSNLINSLRYVQKLLKVYTVINKTRRVSNYSDLKRAMARYRVEFNYVGVIPFDSEVMDDFGFERFWTTVYQTLYFRAVIDSWNSLALQENLETIKEGKYHFPPRIFMQSKSGRFALLDRMFILYGFMSIFGAILYYLFTVEYAGSETILLLVFLFLGVLFILVGVLGFRGLLVGVDSENTTSRISR